MNFIKPRSLAVSAAVLSMVLGGFGASSAWAEVRPINVNYNDNSELAIFFPTDQTQQVKDGSPVIADDGNGNKVIFVYDKVNNLIKFKNECDSKGSVTINFFGNEMTSAPCEEKKLFIAQHKPESKAGSLTGTDAPKPDLHQVIVDISMDGTLMAYTFGGKAFTIGSGLTEVDMGDGNFVHFNYLDMKDLLIIKNACESKVDILVKVLDSEFVLKPCQEEKVLLSTAEGELGLPQNEFEPDSTENIQEGREPISPFQA
jgi:hypothetical protein